MSYLLTIGLEIHIKLKSVNKMFCQCKNEQNFDTLLPNTNICPVCTAQPGALPTLSKEVLDKALILGKALNCTINKISRFDRKSYFYPDLPMWYQITQLYQATNVKGQLRFFLENFTQEKTVHIQDAHMENDTGKMIHDGGQALIDFNRAWTPLVEIVTKPDFSSPEEVTEFLKELQRIVRYNDIADADMEKWQMRVDVNISVRKNESDPLGTRVEVKNVNSFGAIRRAIDYEYTRQVDLYEKGESFTQETRWRDDMKWSSYSMRSKEAALDYRYFPEPDLPPLVISDEIMKRLGEQVLEIPHDIIKKMKEEYWFNKEYINALIGDKEMLDYFLALVNGGFDPKTIAKWLVWPIAAWMKENFKSVNELPISNDQFKKFLQITQEWKIMDSQMKIVMDEMLMTWANPEDIITEKWFEADEFDAWKLESIAQSVLDENPTIVAQYKWWKLGVLWFFVGQVMKKTWGKMNPKVIGEVVEKLLR